MVADLIDSGACDAWGARWQVHWQLGTLRYESEELDLPVPHDEPALPEASVGEAYALQQRLLSVSAAESPLARLRPVLDARGYTSAHGLTQLADGAAVTVIGTLLVFQMPPTAKGHAFLTLDDETGMINVILRLALASRARAELQRGLVELEGTLQAQGGTLSVIARRVVARVG